MTRKKLIKQAKELLQAASKVYHYRRDVISENRLNELELAVEEVSKFSKQPNVGLQEFEASQDRLDALLRKIGGQIYPKTFFNDNCEVLLVAAIVVIGIRTFFFQPFIIPTNSMYPTYSGMNTVLYENVAETPTSSKKFLRFLTLGARHKSLISNADGEISLEYHQNDEGGWQPFKRVPAKKWFVLNSQASEYTFYVGQTPHKITVPLEYDMREVLGSQLGITDLGRVQKSSITSSGVALKTGKTVAKNEQILNFDITLGDALFVDRISYHFAKPKVGDPFVFRTDDILAAIGDKIPKYYIKRIGAAENETIEIRDGALLVDGEARTESEAFQRNAAQDGEYNGYINQKLLAKGRTYTVPEDSYVALGDNSGNSLDSRYWGSVPDDAVIGKAMFIYYPFTKRWGISE